LYFSKLSPKDVETILPSRQSPGYSPSFSSFIANNKEDTLTAALITEASSPVCIYSDGSGFEGGIGASALLYVNNRLVKSLQYYLGTDKQHTVYEAEAVGLAMGFHLLKGINTSITHLTNLGSDSQAAIRALANQDSHSGQYILDRVHDAVEQLHVKQDRLINRPATGRARDTWKGRTRGVIDIQVQWVPGHMDFAPNEKADEVAKKAAQGQSSDAKSLPPFLRKKTPIKHLCASPGTHKEITETLGKTLEKFNSAQSAPFN
jgi:ribonuclease HI